MPMCNYQLFAHFYSYDYLSWTCSVYVELLYLGVTTVSKLNYHITWRGSLKYFSFAFGYKKVFAYLAC